MYLKSERHDTWSGALICLHQLVKHFESVLVGITRLLYYTWIGLERYQKSSPVPNTQYYWVLPIPIPNANTDIGFLSRVLPQLDTRSEVICTNRASQMDLTEH